MGIIKADYFLWIKTRAGYADLEWDKWRSFNFSNFPIILGLCRRKGMMWHFHQKTMSLLINFSSLKKAL
ncbi:hypothetical protein HanRHA438_Chr04g0150981 [Helianthus annuus]|uniref:Uncharacterized protein n=1 Tax=Helianthus annuus TaxID=4232 RepID=A0A9K3NPF1_HELAN|nr:hypothetical protein HanXRQr2_Chr04g0139501 [Helianthus annuus]KAJ0579224.1 hypothetical protein HanHA300_Chr04g0115641 [Helianthus annuus]KAJ0924660.1 hypothetical protein HanRHA438_Chr04g0150981 [Helianthus annuus]KAJ0929283.1 hypothetical protein HanPSC8_Chr04g0135921 [Helianthus annuus]